MDCVQCIIYLQLACKDKFICFIAYILSQRSQFCYLCVFHTFTQYLLIVNLRDFYFIVWDNCDKRIIFTGNSDKSIYCKDCTKM